jgi:hypothetical protein
MDPQRSSAMVSSITAGSILVGDSSKTRLFISLGVPWALLKVDGEAMFHLTLLYRNLFMDNNLKQCRT